MTRRMIESEIWFNEKVANLPITGRLLFIGIFSTADDDGRLIASPKYLKAHIFPYDDDITAQTVKDLREQCVSQGLFQVYSTNGREYLQIPGWENHQLIRKDRYKTSKLPPPDDQPTANPQPADNQPTTNGKRSIGKYNIDKDNIYSIFELWNSQEIIQHRKLTDDIKRAINGKLKDYSLEDIQQAIKNYTEILKGDEYYWTHTWTLKEFLTRGLEKFGDIDIVRRNYRIDDKQGGKAVKKGSDMPSRYKPVN